MDIGTFWVGQVPANPMSITVLDESGIGKDLTAYDSIKLKVIGPRDNTVSAADEGELTVQNATTGRLLYTWPETTLFDRAGQYVLQLELTGPSVKDFTNTITVYVREAGKVLR